MPDVAIVRGNRGTIEDSQGQWGTIEDAENRALYWSIGVDSSQLIMSHVCQPLWMPTCITLWKNRKNSVAAQDIVRHFTGSMHPVYVWVFMCCFNGKKSTKIRFYVHVISHFLRWPYGDMEERHFERFGCGRESLPFLRENIACACGAHRRPPETFLCAPHFLVYNWNGGEGGIHKSWHVWCLN